MWFPSSFSSLFCSLVQAENICAGLTGSKPLCSSISLLLYSFSKSSHIILLCLGVNSYAYVISTFLCQSPFLNIDDMKYTFHFFRTAVWFDIYKFMSELTKICANTSILHICWTKATAISELVIAVWVVTLFFILCK